MKMNKGYIFQKMRGTFEDEFLWVLCSIIFLIRNLASLPLRHWWGKSWYLKLRRDPGIKAESPVFCAHIWVFPKIGVPPKHPKMIIFSRKTHGCSVPPFLETSISLNLRPLVGFADIGFGNHIRNSFICYQHIRRGRQKTADYLSFFLGHRCETHVVASYMYRKIHP